MTMTKRIRKVSSVLPKVKALPWLMGSQDDMLDARKRRSLEMISRCVAFGDFMKEL